MKEFLPLSAAVSRSFDLTESFIRAAPRRCLDFDLSASDRCCVASDAALSVAAHQTACLCSIFVPRRGYHIQPRHNYGAMGPFRGNHLSTELLMILIVLITFPERF